MHQKEPIEPSTTIKSSALLMHHRLFCITDRDQGRPNGPFPSSLVPLFQAPHTLFHFQRKTELFCSGYSYRLHYITENGAIQKCSPVWSDLKTMLFENRRFLVWTEKTMLSENGGVIKNRHTQAPDYSTVSIQNGRQTLPCGFNFAPIS